MLSMSHKLFVFILFLFAAACVLDANAGQKTVCTITVNSADEKEAFRRGLPADEYRLVELVERGRGDWLASACHQGVRCDILVVSGHYDGRDEFYSDQPGVSEFLPMEEMERASCSQSCSALFSQLKEVYLFGCNTLNPEALKRMSAEVSRSLVRSGHSPAEAERIMRSLASQHSGSSRDRMRVIFDDVPVIYGFSAKAPVGPVAASLLSSYFRSDGGVEIGSGRASGKLLSHFASTSMAVSRGLTATDPLVSVRRDMCQFSDDGLTAAQKLTFIHELLGREMAEVRPYLDRLEKYIGSLSDTDRRTDAVRRTYDEIARDEAAHSRFLAFAHDADEPTVRARMIKLARDLGWLSKDEERSELAALIRDRLAGNVNPADVALVCGLNEAHELDSALSTTASALPVTATTGQSAVLACLGSPEARASVLPALTSPRAADFEIAQVYLRYRPLADARELRIVTADIVNVSDAKVQVRALDTLACQHLSDPESLEQLARLFPMAQTPGVQAAIAGVLLRSDYDAIKKPELVQSLRESRLGAQDCLDVVDVLIRRLEAP
jgi:hypothetical protein